MVRGGRRPGGTAARGDMLTKATLPLEAIGSGSDFAAFLDHLGIASLSLGFGGEDRSGTYHSAYDDPWFEEHFGDKDELYGKALAQTAGTLMMRAADADVLPYDFTILTTTLKTYDSELKALLKAMTEEAETRKRNLDLGFYVLTNDPKAPTQAPPSLAIPPEMDFSPIDNSIAALEKAAASVQQAEARWTELSPEKRKALNAKLTLAERKFAYEGGLPRRPWVKHLLYAPGTLTGYGAKTIPGVREALEQMRYDEAKEQIILAAKVIRDEADYLRQITEEFGNP